MTSAEESAGAVQTRLDARSRAEERLGWTLVAPATLAIACVALYPLAWVVWLSLRDRMILFGVDRWCGLANYSALLGDARFWNALFNTGLFTVETVAVELVAGLAIALVLNCSFPGRGLARAAVLIPWAIPTVVSARMFEWMYNSEAGVVNYVLRASGLVTGPVDWLGDPFWAFQAAVLVDVWKTTPFVALLLLAGLQVIPEELYEAARVDGAGALSRFLHVTLPLLRPALLTAALFRALDAFRVFDAIYVLTGGGPADTTETLSLYTYKVLFQTMQFGLGSALGVVTFVCVVAISAVFVRLMALEGVR